MLDFHISDTKGDTDLGEGSPYYRVIVGVTSTFAILIDGKVLYSEEEFPILEFGEQISRWLGATREPSIDFHFESVESEEDDLVQIRRTSSGWMVGSAQAIYSDTTIFPWTAVKDSVERLLKDISEQVRMSVEGIDVQAFLSGTARAQYEANLRSMGGPPS